MREVLLNPLYAAFKNKFVRTNGSCNGSCILGLVSEHSEDGGSNDFGAAGKLPHNKNTVKEKKHGQCHDFTLC